ncbi:apolipoprotein N-acyltransferase [Alistipes sp. OttesenSCG-928-L06]|nr:apolipoprotein N-acyltransferase [Alistipes sp. OttesenSCG-928-L06]
MKKRILLCLTSILLLTLPWLGLPGYTLFAAFVPLFLLQDELDGKTGRRGKPARIFPYIAATLMLWSALSVWWVANSIRLSGGGWGMSVGIAIVCVLVTSFVTVLPFMAYHFFRQRAPRGLAYAVLISAWVGYEFIFLHGEITFPWLILGNGFANSIEAVQWYEYTGVLGGSVWVFACNIAIYEAIRLWRKKRSHRVWIRPAGWIALPLAFSLVLYFSYNEPEKTIDVQVINPNFDPYEKFEALSFREQTEIILQLAMQAPAGTDYFVAPETAIDERIAEETIEQNDYIRLMRYFLREKSPAGAVVIGATTSRFYYQEDQATYTARQAGEGFWYDIYNTALQIDTTKKVAVYHKSRLVAGAEMIPYARQFPFLKKLSMDLGGTSGQMGVDAQRSVFTAQDGTQIGVPICWEAVFGEYTTGFVRQGAEALFIISNDAWWGKTSGYKQLFAFSRLRAIETRRSIARSANVGISGFINQRGDIIGRTQWDERVSLHGTIHLNDRETFYVRFGDVTGRICCLLPSRMTISLIFPLNAIGNTISRTNSAAIAIPAIFNTFFIVL